MGLPHNAEQVQGFARHCSLQEVSSLDWTFEKILANATKTVWKSNTLCPYEMFETSIYRFLFVISPLLSSALQITGSELSFLKRHFWEEEKAIVCMTPPLLGLCFL